MPNLLIICGLSATCIERHTYDNCEYCQRLNLTQQPQFPVRKKWPFVEVLAKFNFTCAKPPMYYFMYYFWRHQQTERSLLYVFETFAFFGISVRIANFIAFLLLVEKMASTSNSANPTSNNNVSILGLMVLARFRYERYIIANVDHRD